MADLAIDNPPVNPPKRPSPASILLPPLLFLAGMFMGADWTAMTLGPLRVLQIAYPRWINYSHLLIPGACAVVWLLSLRKWPNGGAIVAVLLCFTLLPLVPQYAERWVAKVPVTRSIDSKVLESIQDTLGVRLAEQGTREGTFVIVASSNEQRVRAELARLELLGGPPTN